MKNENWNVNVRTKYKSEKRTKKNYRGFELCLMTILFGFLLTELWIIPKETQSVVHANTTVPLVIQTMDAGNYEQKEVKVSSTPTPSAIVATRSAVDVSPQYGGEDKTINKMKKSNEFVETVVSNTRAMKKKEWKQWKKKAHKEYLKELKRERIRERKRKARLKRIREKRLRKKNAKAVPSGFGGVMSFMKWDLITSRSSKQYKLKQIAEHYNKKGMGMINGRFAIAVKKYYGDIGDYLDVTYKDGTILKCIVVDNKGSENEPGKGRSSEIHASSNKRQLSLGVTNKVHTDGSVIEFVVDGEGKTTGWKGFACYNGSKTPEKLYPHLSQPIRSISKMGNYWKS